MNKKIQLLAATGSALGFAVFGVSTISFLLGEISFVDASALALVFVLPIYLLGLSIALALFKCLQMEITAIGGFCAGGSITALLAFLLRWLSAPTFTDVVVTMLTAETFGIVLVGAVSGYIYAKIAMAKM